MEALKHVPPLFEAIKHVKTETGLTWDVATSVRRVNTKEGKVTIATGQDSTYKELETPTKVHGLVGACFSRMWMEPSLAKHFPTYEEFNLVATTISTVYNEAAKTAGLPTRMLKLLPAARGTAPPKRRKTRTRTPNDIKTLCSLSLTLTNLRGTGIGGGSRGAGTVTRLAPNHG